MTQQEQIEFLKLKLENALLKIEMLEARLKQKHAPVLPTTPTVPTQPFFKECPPPYVAPPPWPQDWREPAYPAKTPFIVWSTNNTAGWK